MQDIIGQLQEIQQRIEDLIDLLLQSTPPHPGVFSEKAPFGDWYKAIKLMIKSIGEILQKPEEIHIMYQIRNKFHIIQSLLGDAIETQHAITTNEVNREYPKQLRELREKLEQIAAEICGTREVIELTISEK